MTVLQGLLLGIVQGLTEFLPISSSGHLVLFQKLFNINEGTVTFDIAVHFATLVAVCIVLWRDIVDIIRRPFGRLPILIVIATIPTVIIAFIFKDTFESLAESGITLGFEFILTGLIILYAESVRNKNKGLDRMNYGDAVVIGIAQGIAILPAVSRSGLTIAGALSRGLNREFAARFSFLVSIPAILGAAVIDGYGLIKKGAESGTSLDFLPVAVGMAAAAVSGYFAVKLMFNILAKGKLKYFSYYVFGLGALILIDQLFIGRFFSKLF